MIDGHRFAGNYITSVRAADRYVRVGFGDEETGGERVVVELGLSLEDPSQAEPVTVRLSGTSYNSIAYANMLARVLAHAVEVAQELEGMATDRMTAWWHDTNPEIAKGIVSGRSDYALCAYLILNGVGAFYERGRVVLRERGSRIHDLEKLRETALRILNEKVEVR